MGRPRENGPASNRKGHSMRRAILALVIFLLVAATPLVTAIPAFAGGEKGDWELGVYVGKAWLDDYGIFHPKDHALYGARLGYFLTDHWGLEASGQTLKTETQFTVLGVSNQDVKATALRLNLLYNFADGENKIRPFLTAGLGSEKFKVENYGESCDIGWNAGGGLRFFFSPHVNLRLDGRYVSTKVGDQVNERQHNTEATVGLGFLFGPHHNQGEAAEAPEVHEVAPPPVNQPPTVSCAAARAEILPGETVTITATGADPENGPLTYDWTATGGHVTGNGAGATLDFTGTTPPATASITVRVTDDHGNTATSDCTVRLLAPAKPAAAVSCTAGSFPRNFSRLSNVDKACLDDVAQRLSADPRAHVVVIGHADAHETSKTVAQARADAVREYLVKERSIDPSRVTTRSAGKTKPLAGADAAGNRRVEVWFVPDGATIPGE